jgi:hypothetical protein
MFMAIRQDEAAFRPAVEQLCQLLGVNAAILTRYPAGSRPVYTADELVLKSDLPWYYRPKPPPSRPDGTAAPAPHNGAGCGLVSGQTS